MDLSHDKNELIVQFDDQSPLLEPPLAIRRSSVIVRERKNMPSQTLEQRCRSADKRVRAEGDTVERDWDFRRKDFMRDVVAFNLQ